MCGGNNRLRVSVGERFGEALTCKIRVEVRVNGHLVDGLTSQQSGEETAIEVSNLAVVLLPMVFI
jgi:hypothetical protein